MRAGAWSRGHTLKSMLLTYSKIRQGVFDCGSRTCGDGETHEDEMGREHLNTRTPEHRRRELRWMRMLGRRRTISSSRMMLVPPARFCRIFISRLIFFFLTGFRILMMTCGEYPRHIGETHGQDAISGLPTSHGRGASGILRAEEIASGGGQPEEFFSCERDSIRTLFPVVTWIPSKTSEYLPRPTLRTTSAKSASSGMWNAA